MSRVKAKPFTMMSTASDLKELLILHLILFNRHISLTQEQQSNTVYFIIYVICCPAFNPRGGGRRLHSPQERSGVVDPTEVKVVRGVEPATSQSRVHASSVSPLDSSPAERAGLCAGQNLNINVTQAPDVAGA